MAIAVASLSTGSSSGGNVTVTKPSGTVNGDFLLAIGQADPDGTTFTAPAGWTQTGSTFTGTNGDIKWWYKVASSEGSSYTWTADANAARLVTMLRITGADTSSPIDAAVSNTEGTTSVNLVAPSVSPANSGSLLVCCAMGLSSGATRSYQPPSGMTEQVDISGTWIACTTATQVLGSSGATGTKTFVCDGANSDAWTAGSVAIKASASGTSYDKTPADAVGITDSASPVVSALQGPADSVGVTDARTVVQDNVRAPADAVGGTDSVAAVAANDRVQSDAVGLTDSVSAAMSYVRTVADPVGITDAASGTLTGLSPTIPDNVGITDSVAAVLSIIRTPADNVGITDAAVDDDSEQLVESVGITDSIDASITYTRNIADNVNMFDNITGGIPGQQAAAIFSGQKKQITGQFVIIGGVKKALAAQFVIIGGVKKPVVAPPVGQIVKAIADSLGVSDAVQTTLGLVAQQDGSIGVTDSLAATQSTVRSTANPVGITDAVSVVRTVFTSKNDNVGATDSASGSTGTITHGRQINDTNTGLAGAGLTVANLTSGGSGVTISTNNGTYNNKLFTGGFSVTGNGNTFNNCRFEVPRGTFSKACELGTPGQSAPGANNTFNFCEVDVTGAGGAYEGFNVIGAGNTLYRCKGEGFENLVTIWNDNNTLRECYFWNPISDDPNGHHDVVEVYGGSNILIERCKLDRSAPLETATINIAPYGGASTTNVNIYDCYLDGAQEHVLVDLIDPGSGGHVWYTRILRCDMGGHTGDQFPSYHCLLRNDGQPAVETEAALQATPSAVLFPTTGPDVNRWVNCSDLTPDRTGQIVIPT